MYNPLNVLVTGATGSQGGAVARRLLDQGHTVRALMRNPDSPAAQKLKFLGAIPAVGNFDDPRSLRDAMKGMDAVFAMGTFMEAGVEAEVRHGKALADAAQAAGIRHVVYSSVANADRDTGIPHFDSKRQVEKYIQSLNLPYTIIGPAFFMENVISPWLLPGIRRGELALALPAFRSLPMIALSDLGAFAVVVIENRNRFLYTRIDLASDEITCRRAAEVLSDAAAKTIRHVQTPIEQVRAASADLAAMYEWFDRIGLEVDILSLRRDYPEVHWHTFESWARSQDWATLAPKAYPPEAPRKSA